MILYIFVLLVLIIVTILLVVTYKKKYFNIVLFLEMIIILGYSGFNSYGFIKLIINDVKEYNLSLNAKVNKLVNSTLDYLYKKYGISADEFEVDFINLSEYDLIQSLSDHNDDVYLIYKPDNYSFSVTNSNEDTLIYDFYRKYFPDDSDIKEEISKKMEDLIDYLKLKGLNVEFSDFGDYYYVLDCVPNDYGKIPTRDELLNLMVDYVEKYKFTLKIDSKDIKDNDNELEIRNYIINLTNYIIEYYGELDEYKLHLNYNNYNNGGKSFYGDIIVNSDKIRIDFGPIDEEIER